jgi:hypothetical protein
VLRGGSWNNNPTRLRSSNRNNNTPDNRNNNNGFRLASTAHARAAFTIGERVRSGRVQEHMASPRSVFALISQEMARTDTFEF